MSSNFDDDTLFGDLVPQGTIRVTLPEVLVRSDKPLVLVMRHAGESNHAFMNAKRKMDNSLRSFGDTPPPEVIRERLIGVFAKTVIVGWENANGKDGKPIPFSPDEVEACLLALVKRKRPDLVEKAMLPALKAEHFAEGAGTAESLGNG